MIIVSQNLTNYDLHLPIDSILRINLAWCNSLEELKSILEKHTEHQIFFDLPIKRVKPPNNTFTLDDLIPILESNEQVIYFAISNVDSPADLEEYIKKIPTNITLVPKIESPAAVNNISEIVNVIPSDKKIVMLDHDDLFSKIIKNDESVNNFKDYIRKLTDFCTTNEITLLRTVGVIFSDDEKRVSGYVK